MSPTRSRKSATSRDLPIPAGPSSVNSRQACSSTASSKSRHSRRRSRSQPRAASRGAREAVRGREEVEQAVGRDGLCLALERERLHRLRVDGVSYEHQGLGADQRLAGWCRLLETGGDVDRVGTSTWD